MSLGAPRDDSLMIIALQTVKQIARNKHSKYTGANELVTNRQNSDMKHPQKYIKWSHEATIWTYISEFSPYLYCEADI